MRTRGMVPLTAAYMALALLASCANWEARGAFMKDRFYGKPIDEAIRYFGVPTGRVFLADGAQVVEFETTIDGGYRCQDQFLTDPRGIIVSSRHGGMNACAMGKPK